MELLLPVAVAFLAFSNGANDNFKGVASLFGSRTCSYRAAIGWATVMTFLGSLAAIVFAQLLLTKFTGKGLVPDAVVASPGFLVAVALGAGFTVILATLAGCPISTTHALTGALVGSGWMAIGAEVQWHVLGKAFFLPLLMSPLLAVALGAMLYLLMRWCRLTLGIQKEWCVCVGAEQREVPIPQPTSVLAAQPLLSTLSLQVAEPRVCTQRYVGRYWAVSHQRLIDIAHFLSAGIVSFARGLNDTPKMAALLLLFPLLNGRNGMIAVAVAIALGGLMSARRVAETLSHKITCMNHGQGFSANLATGVLVMIASLYGWPVSTTHVSVGALFGIGLTTRQADKRVIRNILLAWLLTLPCAAVAAGAVYWMGLQFT